MQGVNVFENGIGYLLKCLNLYTSGTGYFVMYLLAVMYILIKGSRRERELFLWPSAVLVLTVYNPVVPLIIDKLFDISSEYYRLFWIAPVIVLVPYAGAKIISEERTLRRRIAAGILVAVMFILGGNFVYAKGFLLSENIYRIPDELIEISDIIHNDSDSEYTRVFFEYEYNMEIRQYDPKILLCIDREDYLYAVNYSYTDEMLEDGENPQNRLLALLVRNQDIDEDDFTEALEDTDTQYVVLTKGHPQTYFVKQAGLVQVGETKYHNIFRFDPEDSAEYELVDYSDVEHRFSYRRLK